MQNETGIVVYSDTISSTLNNETCSDDKKKTTDDDVQVGETVTLALHKGQQNIRLEAYLEKKDKRFGKEKINLWSF